MTRILVLAFLTAFVTGILAAFGVRDGAEILVAAALVVGFAYGMVALRTWLARGCYERSASGALPSTKPDPQVTHKRRAA